MVFPKFFRENTLFWLGFKGKNFPILPFLGIGGKKVSPWKVLKKEDPPFGLWEVFKRGWFWLAVFGVWRIFWGLSGFWGPSVKKPGMGKV